MAREDAGASRPLCPRTDRVCHNCLPEQAGVPGPQGLSQQPAGTPASEPRGRTLPLAPLTGFLGQPESLRPSTRSPDGCLPRRSVYWGGRGAAPGLSPVTSPACTSPAALLSGLARPGGRRCPCLCGCGRERRLIQDSRPSPLSRSLSRPAALCLPRGEGGLALWPREGQAAGVSAAPHRLQGSLMPGHGGTGTPAGDPALEWPSDMPPQPRGPSCTWRGPRMGWGPCAHPGLPGKELPAQQSRCPGPPSCPAQPTKQPAGAGGDGSNEGNRQNWSHPSEAVLGTPRSCPPLGAHARCYLKGPQPGAWQVSLGQAGQWLPGCRGLRSTYHPGSHKHFRAPHPVLLYYN